MLICTLCLKTWLICQKVISVVSLLIKRLTAAGIVSNSDSFAGYNRFELHDSTEVVNEFLSEQRHLVRQMTELANIRSQLEHEVIPRDGGVVVFGQVERLVELHIMMLIRMERNLFVLREDNRWHPAFGLYFKQIEPEALFVANEGLARAKIRSWLDQDRFKDDERSITLFTQCLKIIPLLGQQVPRYESFLEVRQDAVKLFMHKLTHCSTSIAKKRQTPSKQKISSCPRDLSIKQPQE